MSDRPKSRLDDLKESMRIWSTSLKFNGDTCKQKNLNCCSRRVPEGS